MNKILNKIKLRFLALGIMLLLGSFMTTAQNYPIQLTVFGDGMFSGSLNELAAGSVGNFKAQLSFNDIQADERLVSLQVTLDGGNIHTQTNPYSIPAFSISGGDIEEIGEEDFAQYFNPDNQQNLGFLDPSRILPEATYRLTVKVLDYATQRVISNTAMFVFTIFHGNPPVIQTPTCGTDVSGSNIVVQWQPASAYTLAETHYSLELVEMLPGEDDINLAIETAVLSDDDIYDTGFATFIDIPATDLQEGYTYAFRVKAQAFVDGEEVSILSNNGYSDVCSFTYLGLVASSLCPQIINLSAEKANLSSSANITWGTSGNVDPNTLFTVSYRPTDTDSLTSVFNETTSDSSLLISDLELGTRYQISVKPSCPEGFPDSMVTHYYTPQTPTFKCGEEPEIEIPILTSLLTELNAGDVFYINNLPVLVENNIVANSSGVFESGEGHITFVFQPLQEFTPGIEVKFDKIVVDKDYQMLSGLVQTEYDSEWGSVIDLEALTQGGNLQAELATGNLEAHTTLENSVIESANDITLNDNNTITIACTPVGSQQVGIETISVATGVTNHIICDAANQYFAVNTETGEVTLLGIFHGDVSKILASFEETEINGAKMVMFSPNSPYAFEACDADNPYFSCSHYGNEYTSLRIKNGTSPTYYVSWQLIPVGETASVKVEYLPQCDENRLKFITNFGADLEFTKASDNQLELILPAGKDHSDYFLYALYYGESDTTQVGRLHVRTESIKTYDVALVPVGETTLPDVETISENLNNIFAPYGINWNVEVGDAFTETDWDTNDNDQIDAGDRFLSEYSDEQLALHQLYKELRETQSGQSVVFVFPNAPVGDDINEAAKAGDMPINRKWGYLFGDFNENSYRTLAHELGHGQLTLRHTFSNELCGTDPGTTPNLMDYADGTELNRFQWEAIHNPALIGKPFQDDEDGAQVSESSILAASRFIRTFRCDMSAQSSTSRQFIGLERYVARVKDLCAEFGLTGYDDIGLEFIEFKFVNANIPLDRKYFHDLFNIGAIAYDNSDEKITINGEKCKLEISPLSVNKENVYQFVKDVLDVSTGFSTPDLSNVSTEDLRKYSDCELAGIKKDYRKNLISQIAGENIIETSKEYSVYRLLYTTPPADYLEIFNHIKDTPSLLSSLYDGINNYRKEYCDVLLVLYAHVKDYLTDSEHKGYAKLGAAIASDPTTNNSGIYALYRKKKTTAAEFNGDQVDFILKEKMLIEFEFSLPGIFANQNGEVLFSSAPFDIITTELTSIELSPGSYFSTVDATEVAVELPAFYLKYLLDEQQTSLTRNELSVLADVGIDVALFLVGAAELKAGITALNASANVQSITKLILGASDMISLGLGEYCKTSDSQFAQSYREYEGIINIGLLSGSVLNEALPALSNTLKARYVDDIIPSSYYQNLDEASNEKKVLDDLFGSVGYGKYSTKLDDAVEVLAREDLFGTQATTFLDHEYRTVRTTREVTTFRAFGGDATANGTFVTTSQGATRSELALLDEWNNTMRFEARITVPQDVKMNIGKVGPQTSKDGTQTLLGGGDQVILPFQWDMDWIDEITDLTTGKVYNSIEEFAVDFSELAK